MSDDIRSIEALAQSRLISHAAWREYTGKMRPSDIDFVLERNGFFLFGEFKYNRSHLNESALYSLCDIGQRIMYERFLASNPLRHVLAICRHKTPKGELIDSQAGVLDFVLYWKNAEGATRAWLRNHTAVKYQDAWTRFVQLWCTEPEKAFEMLEGSR